MQRLDVRHVVVRRLQHLHRPHRGQLLLELVQQVDVLGQPLQGLRHLPAVVLHHQDLADARLRRRQPLRGQEAVRATRPALTTPSTKLAP